MRRSPSISPYTTLSSDDQLAAGVASWAETLSLECTRARPSAPALRLASAERREITDASCLDVSFIAPKPPCARQDCQPTAPDCRADVQNDLSPPYCAYSGRLWVVLGNQT